MARLKKLSKYEIICMVKQLGMMHILYFMNKQLYGFVGNAQIDTVYPMCKTLEDCVLSRLSTERSLIDHLDAWEKKYWYHNAKKKLNN